MIDLKLVVETVQKVRGAADMDAAAAPIIAILEGHLERERQLKEDRSRLEARDVELREVIDDLRHFIGDTFYANVPHDRKPAPNSWYKGTSKTYGKVFDEIMARVPPQAGGSRGACPKCWGPIEAGRELCRICHDAEALGTSAQGPNCPFCGLSPGHREGCPEKCGHPNPTGFVGPCRACGDE